mmetsp:Transcript_46771/g.113997  ORF Transcript_46771/g.113997 Transcript_46771/m.113997 type:complete len:243 (+) Transcript_46771:1131-1859(+)
MEIFYNCNCFLPSGERTSLKTYNFSTVFLTRFDLLALWLHVRLDEELSKEEEERQDVHDVRGSDTDRKIVTTVDNEVGTLRHHSNELDQLEHGQGRLPPDRERLSSRRVLRVHADEVVRVHDSVDESIQDDCEIDVTIVEYIRVQPVEEEDGNVMVDMEEGQLTPLLSEDDEDRVPEVPNFRHVEQPQEVGQGRVVLAVPDTRGEGVSVTVRKQHSLDGHVGTQHDLRNIVDEFDRVRIHGG